MPRDPINWTTLHLIERHARLGANYGINDPCSVMYTHTARGDQKPGWKHVREIRVLKGRVIAKVQSFCTAADDSLQFMIKNPNTTDLFSDCVHGSFRPRIRPWCLFALTDFLGRSKTLGEHTVAPSGLDSFGCRFECQFCPIEFTLSFIPASQLSKRLSKFARNGTSTTHVLRLTRWIDFGECKASDPSAWIALTQTRWDQWGPWHSNFSVLPRSFKRLPLSCVWNEDDSSKKWKIYKCGRDCAL
jgi:hypothetical protein